MKALVKSEAHIEKERLDRPILFYKIGVLGCAPLDFCETLAEEYDTSLVSSDRIRKELMDARDAEGLDPVRAQNINSRDIKRVVSKRTSELLEKDGDVVLDIFCNTENSRKFPLDLVKSAGALTIALWINTPFRLALERVTEWTEHDAFIIPRSRWKIPPVQAAKAMMSHVEWPSHEEGVDWVFSLDGTGDTQNMLDQFDDGLVAAGLIDRYEID